MNNRVNGQANARLNHRSVSKWASFPRKTDELQFTLFYRHRYLTQDTKESDEPHGIPEELEPDGPGVQDRADQAAFGGGEAWKHAQQLWGEASIPSAKTCENTGGTFVHKATQVA